MLHFSLVVKLFTETMLVLVTFLYMKIPALWITLPPMEDMWRYNIHNILQGQVVSHIPRALFFMFTGMAYVLLQRITKVSQVMAHLHNLT